MQNKTVIITGAGFSAPAKIPIQSEILKEMSRQSMPSSILGLGDALDESRKFLHSFIVVAIYLLENYIGSEYKYLNDEYRKLTQEFSGSDNEYYQKLVIMKEKIRDLLNRSKLDISLEDVFTSFDKTILAGEYLAGYSHSSLEVIRRSITRLFTYYFSKKLSLHDYNSNSYVSFLRFISDNFPQIGVITTNWDPLLETYFDKNNIKYNLCLNEPYYIFDNSRKNQKIKKGIKYIKIHGSINWFNCLNCGTLSIFEKSSNLNFLFNDNSEEECRICHFKPKQDEILLQSAIVSPTMLKSLGNQLYRNLWMAAQRELMTATKVIFLGYSFPIADYEFRYLLQRNIKHDAHIDVVLYKNDNPKKIENSSEHIKELLPEKRYKDVFRRNPINFYYEGFDSYFRNL
jgi:NAD-dependent SIR2 family protein deacetylase